MADPIAIEQMMMLLGADAADNGWNEIRVGTDIDNGLSQNQIALAYWQSRMANFVDVVDTSEGGSSRSTGQAWQHAQAMVVYYQARVVEETPIVNDVSSLRSYPITRV